MGRVSDVSTGVFRTLKFITPLVTPPTVAVIVPLPTAVVFKVSPSMLA